MARRPRYYWPMQLALPLLRPMEAMTQNVVLWMAVLPAETVSNIRVERIVQTIRKALLAMMYHKVLDWLKMYLKLYTSIGDRNIPCEFHLYSLCLDGLIYYIH